MLTELAAGHGQELLGALRWVHWVDPGLNTPGLVFPQPQTVVDAFQRIEQACGETEHFVSWTPRQFNCAHRKYIAQEGKAVERAVEESDSRLVVRMFFEGEEPSLHQHFRILDHAVFVDFEQ